MMNPTIAILLVASLSLSSIVHGAHRPPRCAENYLRFRGEGSSGGELHLEDSTLPEDAPVGNRPRSFFRVGKSKKGFKEPEQPIELRAERFFDRGGVLDPSVRGVYHHHHEKFFREALAASTAECDYGYPGGYTNDMLKQVFMQKVADYRHNDVLTRGVEKFRKEGLEMTIEEFNKVRLHFLNQNPPPEGTKLERQSASSLKSIYRKQLNDPKVNKEKVYKNMAANGYTLEDLKPYTLPPTHEIRDYIGQLRASRERGIPHEYFQYVPSTVHVAMPLYRSNREEQFDLNETQDMAEDDDDLTLQGLQIDGDTSHENEGEEEEDDMPYNRAFHNPFPGAYEGNFYRAYPHTDHGIDDDEDRE